MLRSLRNLLTTLLHRPRFEREMEEEIGLHLQHRVDDLLRSGIALVEAKRRARLEFGAIEAYKEQCRDAMGLRILDGIWADVRFALRTFWKSPVFTVVVILTLALGIGANTAIFSVVDGVLLNPLPYDHPNRLIALYSGNKEVGRYSISYPNFVDWVRDNHSFSGLAAFVSDDFDMTGIGEPQRVAAERVSANFFQVLGVQPVLGRSFKAEEDQVGGPPVVMISGGLWASKFGSSREVLGKTLKLNGEAYTIVGVVPGNFRYDSGNFHARTDVFVPIGQWNEATFRDRRAHMGTDAVGRLKPGITLSQAKADMTTIADQLARAYPDANKGTGIILVPLKEDFTGGIRPFLLVLLAAVAFVLLIACTNVASLLLARSRARSREFAIRAALGATPQRVVRQLLTESCMLSLTSGALGLALAVWGTKTVIHLIPEALPRAESIGINAPVLLFTTGVSVLTGIIFGLVPALKCSQADLAESLKEQGRGSSGVRHRTQRVLVVTEMAMAVVLLIGAGLMIRSVEKLWSVNPGFDPRNVMTFGLSSPRPWGATADAVREGMRQIRDIMSSVPGVQSVSLEVGAVPMQGDSELPFWVEGQPKPASDRDMKMSLFYAVQPDYLKLMRIPLLRGRFLTVQDNEHSPAVMVIDEDFAKLVFGDQDPIGRRINFEILNTSPEIVGVVGHVKQWGLGEDSRSSVQAQCYLALSQVPDQFLSLMSRGTGVFMRTAGSPLAEVSAIRHVLGRFNGEVVMYDVKTMPSIISDSLGTQRFSMILLGIFAGLALALSVVGIYGVISYISGQRTHEIGIRMALGAQPTNILGMIVGQGARLAVAGVGIGAAAAFGLTHLMSGMIFGISTHDPATFGGVAVLLFIIAMVACYFPARRATRTDPIAALRHE